VKLISKPSSKIALCALILLNALGVDVHAQVPALKGTPRVGFIVSTGPANSPSPLLEAFRRGLRELGYNEGKNITIEVRYAEGKLDRMPGLVNELIQQKVDFIFAANNVAIRAAKAATKSIPIIMVASIDPVTAGYVESFARPGGNITGYAHMGRDLSGKRLELLKELIPKVSRIAILWDTDGPGPKLAVKEYEAAAQALKLQVRSIGIRGPKPDFQEVFRETKNAQSEALVVVGNPLVAEYRRPIFISALAHHLPTITEDERYVRAGGLASYGADLQDIYRGTAVYIDAILKGAKPGDLRIKQADLFELFINLKTANQLGLKIPKYVLVRANEVIE
jgi:putative tryptophan/tyrosine transport system substrate-binding protein